MKNQLKFFKENMLELKQHYLLENKQLKEDWIISQTAAINRLTEGMYLEKQAFLSAIEGKLKGAHDNKLQRLTTKVNRQKAAVEQERRSMNERVVDLENKLVAW
ncbi:hypothetical protein DPMN_045275 [Dreissena polymorpha]|uniref:Uncharacterized protein n=1 Tax=Dreissena polymorpha TaxID=45954 RepID=A0A9D4D681_DREPO|nr:hypothetical protein DPMN_045275 [Dreissena polymorpha]